MTGLGLELVTPGFAVRCAVYCAINSMYIKNNTKILTLNLSRSCKTYLMQEIYAKYIFCIINVKLLLYMRERKREGEKEILTQNTQSEEAELT